MRRAVLFLLLTLQPILAQADFTSDLNEAESAFAAGEYEDALMNYALLVKQPNGNSLLIKQAETSYFAALKTRLTKVDKRLAQAATILETLAAKEPNNELAFSHLARVRLTQALKSTGKERVELLESARDAALQALALNDLDPLANQILGRWHLEVAPLRTLAKKVYQIVSGADRQASLMEAQKLLQIATNGAPDDIAGWTALAQVYEAQQQSDKAKVIWKKAATLTPHHIGDELAIAEARTYLKPKTKISLPKFDW